MFKSLQICRAVAAIAVVCFHSTELFGFSKYWGWRPFGNIFMPGNSGVYLFFVLSGFIILHAHAQDIGRPRRISTYLRNRFVRLYPMYWIVAGSVLIASILLIQLYDQRVEDPLFIASMLTLLPLNEARGNLAVAWTLYHEIVFYLAFCVLIASKFAGLLVLSGWALLCVAALWIDMGSGTAAVIASPLNLLFFLGLLARVLLRYGGQWPWLPCFAAGASAVTATWTYQVAMGENTAAIPVAVYGLASAAMILGLAIRDRHNCANPPEFLMLLGAASYSIYLVHYPAISLLAKILVRMTFIPDVLSLVLLAFGGTAAGVLAHLAVERPLLRYMRRSRYPLGQTG